MRDAGVPTGDFEVVHDARSALQASKRFGFPMVLKADGLAAGKGVLIPRNREELERALDLFFEQRRFGQAGDRVVVEEFLEGEEVSFIAMCDGSRILPLASSKDYKRIGDDDQGPNTGGMGAHSPAGVASFQGKGEILQMGAQVMEQVLHPTVAALGEMGRPFKGFLYAGLVLSGTGLKVLEFNVRLGDPETQPLLMRMEDDLLPLLVGGADGDFGVDRLHFKKEAAACVVLAAEGYPGKAITGEVIEGLEALDELDAAEAFHAGTAWNDSGEVITAGGRVINVCATGTDLPHALQRTYDAAGLIRWPHRYMRRDIGRRVVEMAREPG